MFRFRFHSLFLAGATSLVLAAGCASSSSVGGAAADKVAEAAPLSARSVMAATEGNSATGTVSFTEVDGGVRVIGVFAGLTPGEHGFHVHEVGDCSAPDGTSAGGHFNPEGHAHGLPDQPVRHAGDLGNLVADETGAASLDRVFEHLSLRGATGIIGRGLIVHAAMDDGGQPTGNAGARVACGVIEAKP
ncbi:MAG: superoxide dismutase [Deltaproteobacteria bacterium HGW-Deltaproteobacteria-14]|nr:MAG: superoxide dismutase [Deltaproteobacteria bacterium HGW-Deltaproteobacteria-14]